MFLELGNKKSERKKTRIISIRNDNNFHKNRINNRNKWAPKDFLIEMHLHSFHFRGCGLTANSFNLFAHVNSITGLRAENGYRNGKIQYKISPARVRMSSIGHDVIDL